MKEIKYFFGTTLHVKKNLDVCRRIQQNRDRMKEIKYFFWNNFACKKEFGCVSFSPFFGGESNIFFLEIESG